MATEAPVLLIVEIEPAETASLAVGASYRSHLQILDADSRQPVDPDTNYPQLIVTPPFQSSTTYSYGTGSVIIKNSTGNYQADIPMALAGTNRSRWTVEMGSVATGSNTTEVQGVLPDYW